MTCCPRAFAAILALLIVAPVWAVPAHAELPATHRRDDLPTLAPLLKQVTPGVVNIAVKGHVAAAENPLLQDPFFRRFFDLPDMPREREFQSVGSGVIVDAGKDYVLTNHHVVKDADEITVTLKDGRRLEAKLVGSDPGTDIAVLKVEPESLEAVALGDSDRLEVGDFVLAIGNPFGLGQTVTSGIVSALGRGGINVEGYEDFIQTDASINPGNSGGALVNLRGELVGINTAIIAPGGGNVGIGFAVPVNMASAIMEQIVATGAVRRGRLGVVIQDLTPDLAQALGIERRRGAVVTQVTPNSPAEEAGLRPGDVIVAVNGNPVRDSRDLRNRVGLKPVGARLMLDVLRDGDMVALRARVGEIEAAPPAAEAAPGLAGATFADIAPNSPIYRQIEGVVVIEVERGSRAWRRGLRAGDVVVAVNRDSVSTLAEFRQTVAAVRGALALSVLRDGRPLLIVVG